MSTISGARRAAIFSLIAVLLGCALLMLAVPRTVAAWTALEGRTAILKLDDGVRPSTAELQECVAGYEQALRWVRSSLSLTKLGSCEFEMAAALPPQDSQRAQWLARAEAHTNQGLTQNPADGYAWSRLAFIRAQRGSPARDVVAALIMSLDTAPNSRALWPGRSRLVLFYAPNMTVDELFTVRHQLRTIWTYGPWMRPKLVEAAHTLDRMGMLLWALGDDREAMTELETMERNSRFP